MSSLLPQKTLTTGRPADPKKRSLPRTQSYHSQRQERDRGDTTATNKDDAHPARHAAPSRTVEDITQGSGSVLPPAPTAEQLLRLFAALQTRYAAHGMTNRGDAEEVLSLVPRTAATQEPCTAAVGPSAPHPDDESVGVTEAQGPSSFLGGQQKGEDAAGDEAAPAAETAVVQREKDFIASQLGAAAPTAARLTSCFAAAGAHSPLGRMLHWFSESVVRMFTEGLEAVAGFPREWERRLRRDKAELNAHLYELQGFGVLFSFVWAQVALMDAFGSAAVAEVREKVLECYGSDVGGGGGDLDRGTRGIYGITRGTVDSETRQREHLAAMLRSGTVPPEPRENMSQSGKGPSPPEAELSDPFLGEDSADMDRETKVAPPSGPSLQSSMGSDLGPAPGLRGCKSVTVAFSPPHAHLPTAAGTEVAASDASPLTVEEDVRPPPRLPTGAASGLPEASHTARKRLSVYTPPPLLHLTGGGMPQKSFVEPASDTTVEVVVPAVSKVGDAAAAAGKDTTVPPLVANAAHADLQPSAASHAKTDGRGPQGSSGAPTDKDALKVTEGHAQEQLGGLQGISVLPGAVSKTGMSATAPATAQPVAQEGKTQGRRYGYRPAKLAATTHALSNFSKSRQQALLPLQDGLGLPPDGLVPNGSGATVSGRKRGHEEALMSARNTPPFPSSSTSAALPVPAQNNLSAKRTQDARPVLRSVDEVARAARAAELKRQLGVKTVTDFAHERDMRDYLKFLDEARQRVREDEEDEEYEEEEDEEEESFEESDDDEEEELSGVS